MKKNALRDKLLKNSTLELASVLSESEVYHQRELITTPVPMVNVALSGMIDGGLMAGILMITGNSKNFKTGFGLLMAQSYLTKYPDGVVLFYDSEFGTNESYFQTFGISQDSIIHSPITNVDELQHDLAVQLESISRGDRVMILVDSIGNLASKKEVDDAIKGSDKADMTRAKKIKSVFRMATPQFVPKNIPVVVINHIYKEIGTMYPRDIVSGGTGAYLSANDIWIVGRQQDKDDDGLQGYNFVIKIEKSRTVKEGSKIPINVRHDHGINKWSGLWENALDGGFIVPNSRKGYYSALGGALATRKQLDNDAMWEEMIKSTDFLQYIEKKYQLGSAPILKEQVAVV